MLLGLAGVLLLYMRKLIEDAEFQGMWISSDILRLLEYSFAFWGRQDIVLLSWAILRGWISKDDFLRWII